MVIATIADAFAGRNIRFAGIAVAAGLPLARTGCHRNQTSMTTIRSMEVRGLIPKLTNNHCTGFD